MATVGLACQILLHGISMGGSTAVLLGGNAQLPQQVAAIIEDSGFSSAGEELRHRVSA